jgi:hypothetical protein
LQSLVWRARWEQTHEQVWKDKLLTYNAEDCAALKQVTACVLAIAEVARSRGAEVATILSSPVVEWADEVGRQASHGEFCTARFAIQDFDHINQCAYFDYQREKVFLRTSRAVRTAGSRLHKRQATPRATRTVEIVDGTCPYCHGTRITQLRERTRGKYAYDLKFTQGGVHRLVTLCRAAWHWCEECQRKFSPEGHRRRDKHLHGLKCWAMYQHIVHRVNLSQIQAMFEECFGLSVSREELRGIRGVMAYRYRKTWERILGRIVDGHLAHADETEVDLKRGKGYVWVLANLEDVVYFYKPGREAAFLQDLLKDFRLFRLSSG